MQEPCVRRAGQHTREAKAQSATGEEWEECKNKKQQIPGMRGPEDPEQGAELCRLIQEQGKLHLIVEQEPAGRKDVWKH